MTLFSRLTAAAPVALICGAVITAQCARIDALNAEAVRQKAAVNVRDAAIETLRREPPWLNAVLSEFSHETTNIADFRKAVRQELKTAMRDPEFAAWAASSLPRRIHAGGGLLGGGDAEHNPAAPAGNTDHAATTPPMDGNDKRRPLGIRPGS